MKQVNKKKGHAQSPTNSSPESSDSIDEGAAVNEQPVDQFSQDEMEDTTSTAGQFEELNDRYLRLAAEYENYRRRTRKEREDFQKTATADLIQKLLPVIDSLNRGVEFNENAESIDAVKEGLVKVNRLLTEILEKEGLNAISEANIPLDLDLHMAVFKEERDDLEDQTVLEVFEKGYSLRGKVLRPAKVKVSHKVEDDSSASTDQDSAQDDAESGSSK